MKNETYSGGQNLKFFNSFQEQKREKQYTINGNGDFYAKTIKHMNIHEIFIIC